MSRRAKWLALLFFLGPSLLILGFLVVWPAIATGRLSFYDQFGTTFVGFDNYVDMFRFDRMRKAIVNSFIWVLIFPFFVTMVGLVFAVLASKVRWRTAFVLILFMPAAIAVMSSGIIWRLMYEADPGKGAVNALLNVPLSLLRPAGPFPGAEPSTDNVVLDEGGSAVAVVEVGPDGGVANIGLLRIPVDAVPEDAVDAAMVESAESGTVSGAVWRDTRSGENEKGVVESGELGLSGVHLELVNDQGEVVATAETVGDGSYTMVDIAEGTYTVVVPSSTFREAWGGITWLGRTLATFSAIIAGIWVWGGFALLIIGAGLAALPEDTLEAARVDGANEFQIFRRITVPLLWPVLTVVFIALTINALKMFDLIVGIAPGSVQDDANVIALEMWRTAFTGLGQRGLGSAIAVFLFLLILPVLVINIRRFRITEEAR